MPKMMINEQDMNSFALEHVKPGETPLVGVYAGLNNDAALGAGILASALISSTLGGAIGGGMANIWCLLFANNNRIVIGILGYMTASVKNIIEIPRQDISRIEIKKGLLNQIIIIRLNDNQNIKFRVSRYGVLGQSNHKQRLGELLKILTN